MKRERIDRSTSLLDRQNRLASLTSYRLCFHSHYISTFLHGSRRAAVSTVTVCPPSPFRVIFRPLAPTTTPLPPLRRTTLPFPWRLEFVHPRKSRLRDHSPLPLLTRHRSLFMSAACSPPCPVPHHPFIRSYFNHKGPTFPGQLRKLAAKGFAFSAAPSPSPRPGRFAHTRAGTRCPHPPLWSPSAERPSHRHRPPTDPIDPQLVFGL